MSWSGLISQFKCASESEGKAYGDASYNRSTHRSRPSGSHSPLITGHERLGTYVRVYRLQSLRWTILYNCHVVLRLFDRRPVVLVRHVRAKDCSIDAKFVTCGVKRPCCVVSCWRCGGCRVCALGNFVTCNVVDFDVVGARESSRKIKGLIGSEVTYRRPILLLVDIVCQCVLDAIKGHCRPVAVPLERFDSMTSEHLFQLVIDEALE